MYFRHFWKFHWRAWHPIVAGYDVKEERLCERWHRDWRRRQSGGLSVLSSKSESQPYLRNSGCSSILLVYCYYIMLPLNYLAYTLVAWKQAALHSYPIRWCSRQVSCLSHTVHLLDTILFCVCVTTPCCRQAMSNGTWQCWPTTESKTSLRRDSPRYSSTLTPCLPWATLSGKQVVTFCYIWIYFQGTDIQEYRHCNIIYEITTCSVHDYDTVYDEARWEFFSTELQWTSCNV